MHLTKLLILLTITIAKEPAYIFAHLMETKKSITFFLILVLVLQLLPVKQAVRYFFIDNLMVEEILHVEKNATKNFRLLDEDHIMPEFNFSLQHYSLISKSSAYHFADVLPANHTADIHTPPPNTFFI